MYSASASYSPNKQRVSPPSSPDGPRPSYSILCDETRTLMIAFLRKISSVLQRNERHIQERNFLAQQEQQKALQAAQIRSTNPYELLRNFFLKFLYVQPQSPTTENIQLKPLLPTDIIEQLTNTKNKFSELFQVSQSIQILLKL